MLSLQGLYQISGDLELEHIGKRSHLNYLRIWEANFKMLVERWESIVPVRQMWQTKICKGVPGWEAHLPRSSGPHAPNQEAPRGAVLDDAFMAAWDTALTIEEQAGEERRRGSGKVVAPLEKFDPDVDCVGECLDLIWTYRSQALKILRSGALHMARVDFSSSGAII